MNKLITAGTLLATLNLVACSDSPSPEKTSFDDVDADKISFEIFQNGKSMFTTPAVPLKGQTERAFNEVNLMLKSEDFDKVKVHFTDNNGKSVADYDCKLNKAATGPECTEI